MVLIPNALPIPRHISPGAQAALSKPAQAPDYPALDDTDGWLRHIADFDREAKIGMESRVSGLRPDKFEVSGVDVYVASPPTVSGSSGEPVCLSFHGGGLIYFGGEVTRMMAGLDAATYGLITWCVDYRMPPLHPYPAGLEDGLSVYKALLNEREPQDIFVAGSSAGGNLAAATILKAKDEGLPMPAGLVLFSPEADLTESGDSFATLATADNSLSSLAQVNRLYANGHNMADPYLSPLFGELAGLPPVFLQSGTRDLFLSNTVRMHRKLRAQGVKAELHIFEAMPHAGFGEGPEHQDLVKELKNFIDSHRR